MRSGPRGHRTDRLNGHSPLSTHLPSPAPIPTSSLDKPEPDWKRTSSTRSGAPTSSSFTRVARPRLASASTSWNGSSRRSSSRSPRRGSKSRAPRRRLISVYFSERKEYVRFLRLVEAEAFANTQGYYHPVLRAVFAFDTRSTEEQQAGRRGIGNRQKEGARRLTWLAGNCYSTSIGGQPTWESRLTRPSINSPPSVAWLRISTTSRTGSTKGSPPSSRWSVEVDGPALATPTTSDFPTGGRSDPGPG